MFPDQNMLNRLYVRGSLKNVEGGCEFSINNTIDYTSLYGIGPITVDGQAVDAASIRIVMANQERRGSEITSSNPVSVYVNAPLRVILEGVTLAPGQHQVGFTANSMDIGQAQISFQDTL
jgi:hypothetical protein